MATGRAEVDWEATADLALPELGIGRPDDVGREQAVDGLLLDGLDLSGVDATGVALDECLLRSCVLDDAVLTRARLTSCLLDQVRATSLEAQRSTWRDVVVRGSRIGALIVHGAELTRVTVAASRLDFVNLRGATAAQVQFTGCRIGELDVGQARLRDVRFVDCQVERLVLTGSELERVDLRGAGLTEVEGIGSLAGALIDGGQLQQLAPALAGHLGIAVADVGAAGDHRGRASSITGLLIRAVPACGRTCAGPRTARATGSPCRPRGAPRPPR
jgi:uncharacterized protein YjbI with pentapeptide repeats